MARKKVNVSINGGSVSVTPDPVEVKRGRDDIVWESDEALVIFIQDRGNQGKPTDQGVVSKNGGPGETSPAKVKGNAHTGPFKYDVAVFDDGGNAHGVDPKIMVQP